MQKKNIQVTDTCLFLSDVLMYNHLGVFFKLHPRNCYPWLKSCKLLVDIFTKQMSFE